MMLTPLITLGLIFFGVRWACRAAPPRFLYSLLIALAGMILALPLGFAAGMIGAVIVPTDIGLKPGDFFLGGLKWGMISLIAVPFIVFYYRRAAASQSQGQVA